MLVDDVLARAAEEPRGLLSGQNVLPAHALHDRSPNAKNAREMRAPAEFAAVLSPAGRRHTFPLLADTPDQLRLELAARVPASVEVFAPERGVHLAGPR